MPYIINKYSKFRFLFLTCKFFTRKILRSLFEMPGANYAIMRNYNRAESVRDMYSHFSSLKTFERQVYIIYIYPRSTNGRKRAFSYSQNFADDGKERAIIKFVRKLSRNARCEGRREKLASLDKIFQERESAHTSTFLLTITLFAQRRHSRPRAYVFILMRYPAVL